MSDWRLPEVTEEEVIKTLKNIKLKKGPGQDNITTDMMIKRGGKIRKLIKTLINKYLQQGKIPDTWKSVKVKLEQADFIKGYSTESLAYRETLDGEVQWIPLSFFLYFILNNTILGDPGAKLHNKKKHIFNIKSDGSKHGVLQYSYINISNESLNPTHPIKDLCSSFRN